MERIDKLKELLTQQPADSFLRHALALEYIKIGDQTKARLTFEELLSEEPDYIGSYYHLAKLLESLGEKEQAIAWYEKGLERARGKDQHAYNELLAAYEDLVY
jgi:Tfp pilus assembly protein PilF